MSPDRLKQMTQKTLSQDPLADHVDQTAYVTVLRQEINRFDRLLGIIHTSLSSLRLAVKGEVLMSEQLEDAYNALLSNRVPKAWEVCNCSSIFSWWSAHMEKISNSFPLPVSSAIFFQCSNVKHNSAFTKTFATFLFGLLPCTVPSSKELNSPL